MSRNLSYTYLLPLLSEQVNLQKKILGYVTNTYILTNKNSKLGNLYIKCKFNYSNKEFSKLEDILTSNDLFVDSYDIGEEILYEFKLPDSYVFDQKMFINGSYSQFKTESKGAILEFWTELYGHVPSFVSTTLVKIRHILNKDEKLRIKMMKDLKTKITKGSELGNKIEVEDETFIFEDEKENIKLKELKDIF